jgi:hypothetical protein
VACKNRDDDIPVKNPVRLPKRSLDAEGPPMENPGFKDRGLPVQTVPMIPSTRDNSVPIPITLLTHISIESQSIYGHSETYLG